MIGSFASGTNVSLVAKNVTKKLLDITEGSELGDIDGHGKKDQMQ